MGFKFPKSQVYLTRFSIQKHRRGQGGYRGDLGRRLGRRRSHLILWWIHFGSAHMRENNKTNKTPGWTSLECGTNTTLHFPVSLWVKRHRMQPQRTQRRVPRALHSTCNGDYLWYSGKRGNYSRQSGEIIRHGVQSVAWGGLWWL